MRESCVSVTPDYFFPKLHVHFPLKYMLQFLVVGWLVVLRQSTRGLSAWGGMPRAEDFLRDYSAYSRYIWRKPPKTPDR